MKTYHRLSEARGGANFGWLLAKHSFSFGEYYDPQFMGFRSLRVINEDQIQPKEGFPTHGHKDMEIITYVISGELAHKDSMGNGSVIYPGEFQYMSAGSGVRHSEYNNSEKEVTHLLQIWILPDRARYEPTYDQKSFASDLRRDQLHLAVTGPASAENANSKNTSSSSEAIQIRQDARIYTSSLGADQSVIHSTTPDRGVWIQLIKGELKVDGHEGELRAGDGLAIEDATKIKITANADSEFLLFDLA